MYINIVKHENVVGDEDIQNIHNVVIYAKQSAKILGLGALYLIKS